MKKGLLLFFLACAVSASSPAMNHEIRLSAIKSNLTRELRDRIQQCAPTDTATIIVDKGEYVLSGTVIAHCHVVIRGKGKGKSVLMLENGVDAPGFKSFIDDTFIDVQGTPENPVTVAMSDLSIRLSKHSGIWWEGSEKYAVKIYHANRVAVERVESVLSNAVCTNFNLRVCSNVTFNDCDITNYNNCHTGGNLWLNGQMDNINIKNNRFYKYGNDESVAIISRTIRAQGNVTGDAVRSNINLCDNEFYYGYNGKDKAQIFNEMLVSIITDHQKSEHSCVTKNVRISGNVFHVNDLENRTLYISFDPADRHENIVVDGNEFINNRLDNDERYYRQDIEIDDPTADPDTIYITNNKVNNKCLVVNKYGSEGYAHLLMRGGNVVMDGNQVVNQAYNEKNRSCMNLLWSVQQGGVVTMRNNVCKGLKMIANVESGSGVEHLTVNAVNNYFQGDTRIYCKNVKELNLTFNRNTFVSSSANFFLQEFADKGSLVFNYNDVTVQPGNGQLMTHYNDRSLHDMRFDNVQVRGNVFRGVSGESALMKNLVSVGRRSVGSNAFVGK